MKAWVLNQGATSLDDLHLVERDVPRPGWGEVLIRMRACSLNFRDQAIVRGQYIGGPVAADTVLLSDGAGEIVGLGDGVHDLALGDRVAGIFFQHWLEGPPNPGVGPALGASGALGMLSEYVVLPAQGVIRIARTLSFEEAACLPCAGVTAWNALMCGPCPVQAGDNVLVLGTGGVSLMALQIAKAVGARVVATSSSAGKRERVAAMGADATVNYRDNPQWGAEAATHTGGGFEHVVEVGGAGTLAQSIAAVGFGGEIALIGVLTRAGDTSPHGLMMKGASLRGIFVGSKQMALDLNAFIDSNSIRPVVDRVFPMAQVKDAFAYQSSPDLFGKVVIAL